MLNCLFSKWRNFQLISTGCSNLKNFAVTVELAVKQEISVGYLFLFNTYFVDPL